MMIVIRKIPLLFGKHKNPEEDGGRSCRIFERCFFGKRLDYAPILWLLGHASYNGHITHWGVMGFFIDFEMRGGFSSKNDFLTPNK